jgi:hypothetical protein
LGYHLFVDARIHRASVSLPDKQSIIVLAVEDEASTSAEYGAEFDATSNPFSTEKQ